jgi:hypothetical protein
MAAPTCCAHHPERPGHTLCMECRKVLCAECATDWDGINYCEDCLGRRRVAMRSRRRLPGVVLLAASSALLLVAVAWLMAWTAVLYAGLL